MADKSVVAGQGWVFTGEPDTEPPTSLESFDPKKLTISGFEWLGSTSKENLTEFGREGGEDTVLDAWEVPSLRAIKSVEKWKVTIHSISITQKTFELTFPAGHWNTEAGGYDIPPESSSATKALLIVIKDDVHGYLGVYFPRGTVSLGGVPVLNASGFVELPITVNALSSESTGLLMRWLLPKTLQTAVSSSPDHSSDSHD